MYLLLFLFFHHHFEPFVHMYMIFFIYFSTVDARVRLALVKKKMYFEAARFALLFMERECVELHSLSLGSLQVSKSLLVDITRNACSRVLDCTELGFTKLVLLLKVCFLSCIVSYFYGFKF